MRNYLWIGTAFLLASCVTHTETDENNLDFMPKQSPALYSPTPPAYTQPSMPHPFDPSTLPR